TSRTAATQPCCTRSSARPSVAAGVPMMRSAFLPKIFQTFSTRIRGAASRSMTWPRDPVSATAVTGGAYCDGRRSPRSEKPDRPALGVDVDVRRGGRSPVAWHGLHGAAECHDAAGACVCAEVAHGDGQE